MNYIHLKLRQKNKIKWSYHMNLVDDGHGGEEYQLMYFSCHHLQGEDERE